MGKRIIFCADGTWEPVPGMTNAERLFQALSPVNQVCHFDDGTGPNGIPFAKLTGNQVGECLLQKVQDGYAQIAQDYQLGDEIFLFGGGRGAYTARSLAAMIAICGIEPGVSDPSFVAAAFGAYRDPTIRSDFLAGKKGAFGSSILLTTTVKMLGVWDTVGSLGIPAHISGDVSLIPYGFLDTSLHHRVLNAFQAFAIDERRASYVPTHWTFSPAPGQLVQQVWFSGSHLDLVGGADTVQGPSLSNVSLGWMAIKAATFGAEFKPGTIDLNIPFTENDFLAPIHESWSTLWSTPFPRSISIESFIANSVGYRCRKMESYRPDNLVISGGSLDSAYQIEEVIPEDALVDPPPTPTGVTFPTGVRFQQAQSPEATEPLVPFRATYPAFEGDLVGFDQQSFLQPLRDSLGAEIYASHLAQLIAARKTPLPLSLGLFGDWGAGKSYFMRLLHQQIADLTKRADDVFCKKIVQIHFNAWHYLDTNLWANLVSEIFDRLFADLSDRPDTKHKVEALKKKLAEEGALALEAKKALADASLSRVDAEQKLQDASQKRKKAESSFAGFFDNLKNIVAQDPAVGAQLNTLSSELGMSGLNSSFTQLEASALEARSVAGRLRTLFLAIFSPQGLYRRIALLLAALAVPVLLAWLLAHVGQNYFHELARWIAGTLTFIATFGAWASAQIKRGSSVVGRLEEAYERVRNAQQKLQSTDKGTELQHDLSKAVEQEADATRRLNETQARVRAIESDLQDLTPGRRLLHFLEQRSEANDYRQYLGLVSLVRRDFEQLSVRLREGAESGAAGQPMLDRIVLYIDDLDRCKADRVVAVLEAVHLLLAFPIFAVVVAVDPRWLRQSLMEHYPQLLAQDGNAPRSSSLDPPESPASPQDYLEKIFQVPFQLRPLEEKGFGALIAQLLPVAPSKNDSSLDSGPAATSTLKASPANLVAASPPPPAAQAPFPQETPPRAPASPPGAAAVPPVEPISRNIPTPETPAPVAPERLLLGSLEQAAVMRCHPLFRTPRAVKRLANTYCLIRVGVEGSEWPQFLGSAGALGEYRTPLLMLAVAAAYPALAQKWLDAVVVKGTWTPEFADAPGLGIAGGNPRPSPAWNDLIAAVVQMRVEEFAPFDKSVVQRWASRVKRFTF